MISSSIILTGIGAVSGFILLFYHISVFKSYRPDRPLVSMPILFGTLAWLTACYEFLAGGSELSIEAQRAVMVMSWVWLATVVVINEKERNDSK